ncbi:hypothetical protein [Jeotgalibacillus salarius]|uniref:hypothetical protein n=1 Tax=Jeotgalibacillus salarius TaxID=546023 RepID=UPI00141AA58D|nr:hypothetical protein [Jeotgalibacillus salarius]
MFKLKKVAVSLSIALSLAVSFSTFDVGFNEKSVHIASPDEFSTMDRDRIVKPPA